MGQGDDEARWIAAAQAGSDAAFARLVALHQAPVRAFLRRVLGGDWAEADDLAQETFLTAWRQLHALKVGGALRPWLCGIAWRKARDRLRGGRRAQARDGAWLALSGAATERSGEDRVTLMSVLAALSPSERACVALCLAEGWSHAEAAATLGLPLGTVKSHVSRGRAHLIAALGDDHE